MSQSPRPDVLHDPSTPFPRNTLAAAATIDGRAQITALLAEGTWAQEKLQGSGKDGWTDADVNDFRRWWAGQKPVW